MIGLLAPFFLRAGLGEKAARLASWALLAVAALAALALIVARIRSDAVKDERAAVALAQAAAELAQRATERAAEDQRRQELRRAATAADERRKELDDATRDLPPAATSPRQRARACIELRRQAEAAGEPAPAC